MWDGFDQRKFPRINVECEINIQSKDSQKQSIVTRTENVGIGGVCVLQETPLERFSKCRISLQLDKAIPVIECEARVCWVIPRQDPKNKSKLYDTGIEFVNISPSDRNEVQKFLKSRLPAGFKDLT